ncbi:MAG TPA: NAD(P)H-hydrate dehydratase [Beijerinckiaceae bacterium]|nr:NAD(P)H-hydrate dehydratase [Beijerinckiaceae bacterium]
MSDLLTNAEMRAADARTIAAGTPGYVLMQRAGEAVAEAAQRMLGGEGSVLVLCGPGNNGGDGFVAARLLARRGYNVAVALLGNPNKIRGDAALARSEWRGPVVAAHEITPARAGLLVDALLGSGLDRDLEDEARAVVERINAARRPVLSVDIPSGIDGDTGRVRGAAVKATRTVTFATRKPGHLLYPGRSHCGTLEVADIGISADTIAQVGGRTYANHPDLWRQRLPRPRADAHKYERGHTLVLSGDATHSGAARLTARAALRAGSGLVTLASPSDALVVNAAQLTAIMLRACDWPADLQGLLADARFNALALGPALGIGPRTHEFVLLALRSGRATVLDADALTSFAAEPATLAGETGAGDRPVVLTPHAGEFARLFESRVDISGATSKIEGARRAAVFTGALMVLKGPDTVIAAPDGRAAINENGAPWLATAGSGDVLSGIIGGLLAQGMPGFEAACAGVWLHAEAGRGFGPGLIAEDLPELLPPLLREFFG